MKRNRLNYCLNLAALVVTALLSSGCFSDPNPQTRYFPEENNARPTAGTTNVTTPAVALGADEVSKLVVGDLIVVSFSDVPPPGLLEIRTRIPADGMITLHYNVRVKALGKTIDELQRDIRNAYVPSLYVNLTAVVKTDERVYFVGGEVRIPNRQVYQASMTVLRAIDTAGGFTDFANKKKIELRRANGEVFVIDWFKASKNPRLDLQVLPNDHITVGRKFL